MIHTNYRLRFFVASLTVLGVLLFGAISVHAGSTTSPPRVPSLTGADVQAAAPHDIAVTGNAFTPSGRVYVALYDPWGAALFETRWTIASPTTYGRDGSVDPAQGFNRGGALSEAFAGLCGKAVMVRAYDLQMANWSNWLDINATGAAHAHYAPNGSADPARGFVSGCAPAD